MISSTISATKPKTPEVVTKSEVPTTIASTTSTSATSVNAPATSTVTSATTSVTSTNEEAINSICEMGFPREEVIRALKASFNNPDRAVEYLTNGIPDDVIDGDEGALETATAVEGIANDSSEAALSSSPLSMLLRSPQFIQLRFVVQQNPRLMGPLLEQIAQSNPEVFELIKENQEEFMNLIETPLTEAEIQLMAAEVEGGEGFEGADGDEGEEEDGVDLTTTIQVTEEEKAAIERLMALGFDRPRVIEAYFACDKNETIAANFLFEHMNDDDF